MRDLKLNPDSSVIRDLSSHLSGDKGIDYERLFSELFAMFPEFTYNGKAYRALLGKWSPTERNISWSLDDECAIEACLGTNDTTNNKEVWLYEAQVIGIDLKKLVTHLAREHVIEFNSKSRTFAATEKEILVEEFSDLKFINKMKIFIS